MGAIWDPHVQGLEPVHYLVTKKNRHHGEAIARGFRARTVPAEREGQEPRQRILHLIGGLQHGSLELLMDARAMGLPYVFFDRAYFGGGPGTDRLRSTRNAYQQHWIREGSSTERLKQLGIAISPWRSYGGFILVIPPSAAICRVFGLGDWEAKVRARLTHCTDRPVRVSYKPDPIPLAQRLRGCWAVVTWTSNVAVEAVCAGVPAFVGPESAAAPVATQLEYLEEMIERPLMPERDAWAASLAWGQFTLEEIASGFAREVVLS